MKHSELPWEVESHNSRGETEYHAIVISNVGKMVRSGVVADTLNRDHLIAPEEDQANAEFIVRAVNFLHELRQHATKGDTDASKIIALFDSYSARGHLGAH